MTTDFKKSLDSEESLVAFLAAAARSEEFQALRRKAEEGPHVSEGVLEDYVADRLEEQDIGHVMDHLAFCSKCAGTLATIRERFAEQMREGPAADRGRLEEALQNDEAFESFLTQLGAAAQPDIESLQRAAHLSEDEILDYAEGALTEEQEADVMEHLCECPLCLEAVTAQRNRSEASPSVLAELETALDSDEAFEALLLNLRPLEDDKAPRIRPNIQTVIDYVQGALDEDREAYMMDAMIASPKVLSDIAYARQRLAAVDAEGSDWAAHVKQRQQRIEQRFLDCLTPPLLQKVAAIDVSRREVPDITSQAATVKPSLELKRAMEKPLFPGDLLEVEVDASMGGWLWVVLGDPEGHYPIETIFPSLDDPITQVLPSVRKVIRIHAPDLPADYFLRAVWTQDQLIKFDARDLDNRFLVQELTEKYLEQIRALPKEVWTWADLTFVVEEPDT